MIEALAMPRPVVRLPPACTLETAWSDDPERRESRILGPVNVDAVLECWQLAMVGELDWLPLAAERSNIAAWLAMDADGISWRYAIELTAGDEELDIIETLTAIGSPAC